MKSTAAARSIDDRAFQEAVAFLRETADETDRLGRWPREQLRRCAEAGALRWFAPAELGGTPRSQAEILRDFTRLAAACLTTTFCLTQPAGVVGRLAVCDNGELRDAVVPQLLTGESFATVGIAHLTTSRRHTAPVLQARAMADGNYRLDGVIPWSTGAAQAQWIVTGAVLDDGRQLLACLPTDLPGLTVERPVELVGLSATATGAVRCDGVCVEPRWLMAPVVADVLKYGNGAGTGGLQTSALALGTALAAIDFLTTEAERRPELEPVVAAMREEREQIETDLRAAADGIAAAPSADEIRRRANQATLRAAQAALVAAKGSGYVVGHPAGRWCREALFFLVWSCPAPVTNATLCELARI